MRGVFVAIAALWVVVHGLNVAASRCWVYPDSIDYIQLAGGIVDRFDFTDELYLVRTPGYPLFLAAIFALFGQASPWVIVVSQHGMMLAAALLLAATAWRITGSKLISLLAGCLCVCSLQLIAYANLVLTEAPYTLILVAAVYCLVRFSERGVWKWLAAASLLAGFGYLLRPIALYLLPVCGVMGLRQVLVTLRTRGFWRPLGMAVVCSATPALLIAAPWMIVSSFAHKSLQATRCLDYVYYFRAATVEGLDSTTSEAMIDIHRVIAEAQAAGHLGQSADWRDRGTVIKAYQAVRHAGFAESSAVLGRAGRDLMREHPWTMALGTFRYAAWLLLSPDPVYRFQPGGAAGIDGKRDMSADLYDIATYSAGPGSWESTLRETEQYLPLRSAPMPTTHIWSAVTRWFHRHVDVGASILGLSDSLFEEIILLTLLGGLASLFLANRPAWWMIAAVIGLHVLVSVFLGGPQTRYAAPVRPILCLYLALAPYAIWHGSLRVASVLAAILRRGPTRKFA